MLRWTLPRAFFVTAAVLLLAKLVRPPTFPGWRPITAQILIALSVCLLLIDVLFQGFLSVPFTVPLVYSKRNLAFYVAAFLLLFVPLIQTTVDTEHWIERNLWHFLVASLIAITAHLLLERKQRKMIRERADWPEDMEIEEFPQRLGLS